MFVTLWWIFLYIFSNKIIECHSLAGLVRWLAWSWLSGVVPGRHDSTLWQPTHCIHNGGVVPGPGPYQPDHCCPLIDHRKLCQLLHIIISSTPPPPPHHSLGINIYCPVSSPNLTLLPVNSLAVRRCLLNVKVIFSWMGTFSSFKYILYYP